MSPITVLTLRLTICALGLYCFVQFIVSLRRQHSRTRFDMLFLAASVLNVLSYVGLGWWTISELFFGPLKQPWLTAAAALTFSAAFLLPLGLDYMISFQRGCRDGCPPRWTLLLYVPAIVVFLAIVSQGGRLLQAQAGGHGWLGTVIVSLFFFYMIPITGLQTVITREMMKRGLDNRERSFLVLAAILLIAEFLNWLVCYVIWSADLSDPYSPMHLGTIFLPIPAFLVIAFYNYRFTFLDVILKRLLVAMTLIVLGILYQFVVSPRILDYVKKSRPQSVQVASILLLITFVLAYLILRKMMLKVLNVYILRRTNYKSGLGEIHRIASREDTREGLINRTLRVVFSLLSTEQARFVEHKPGDPHLPPNVTITRPLERLSLYSTRESLNANVIVTVPVATHGHAFGSILLGRRRHDAPYLSDEIALLEAVAHELAGALEHIELHEQQQRQELQTQRLRELAARAELRALQSQINPHFLFNSLNTVAGLIRTSPDKAEKMIENLAEVFRYALDGARRDFVTLGDEIEFARTYLEIEQQRFEEKLDVEVDFDPTLREVRVPAMILQPLVENAIKHGISPKLGPGWVRVAAASQNGTVHVEIEDNGIGMKDTVRDETGEFHPPSRGLGLANVDQRLRAVYGERSALEFESCCGTGTRVFFDIPRLFRDRH